jgi:hypothetical protein
MIDVQTMLDEAKVQYDKERLNMTVRILEDIIEEINAEMEPVFVWRNVSTGEVIKSDIPYATVSYNEHDDETMVFIGETNVAAAAISGKIDEKMADEIIKESGWTVKKS